MEVDSIATFNLDKEKVNGMIDVRACNKPAGKVSLIAYYILALSFTSNFQANIAELLFLVA
mgnify:CR=1 FL=1